MELMKLNDRMTRTAIRKCMLGVIVFCFSFLFVEGTSHAEQTLLIDDFSAGLSSDWQPFTNYWRNNDQQFYAEGGAVQFNPSLGADPDGGAHDALLMYTKGYAWSDYIFEADVKGSYVGVWFRGTFRESVTSGQWVTGYYVTLSNGYKLWKIQTPENCVTDCDKPQYLYHFSNPTLIEQKEISVDPNRMYHITVEVDGSHLLVQIDGEVQFDVMDSDFQNGTVGLFSYRNVAEFDNISVVGSISEEGVAPRCSFEGEDTIESFEGVRIFLSGSEVASNDGGIISGKWVVYDSQNNKVTAVDTMDGYVSGLTAGQYTATLTVTSLSGLTSSCSKTLEVYSPDGFSGTVSVTEVSDYSIPSYTGSLYADSNPKKAVIVSWPDRESRFVFWHEASYVPYWEYPNGLGANYQFFEGADGSGELFNQFGRMEKNSWVEIVQNDSKLAIVKWSYYDVNMDSGERVGYAEEYYYCFPNGLILREMQLQWGNSFEPMEIMMINPAGVPWWQSVPQVGNRYHMSSAVDIYSGESREYWGIKGTTEKSGYEFDGAGEAEIEDAAGVLMRSYVSAYPDFFVVYGNNSYVVNGDIKEVGKWGYPHFVHWPIGWLNSEWKRGSDEEIALYPSHTSMLGTDVYGSGPYYWLLGVSDEPDDTLSTMGKEWLDNIFRVPCSSEECQINDLPDVPAGGDSSWIYDSTEQICKRGSSGQQGRIVQCAATSVTFERGWSIIALPEDTYPADTYWFLHQADAAQKGVDTVSLWTANNKFEGSMYRDGEIFGNAVNVDNTTPLFVHSDKDITAPEFRYPQGGSSPVVSLSEGWNAVVLRGSQVGTDGVGSTEFLDTVLNSMLGDASYSRRQVAEYDSSQQKWKAHILENGNFYGFEFILKPDAGYLVYVGE